MALLPSIKADTATKTTTTTAPKTAISAPAPIVKPQSTTQGITDTATKTTAPVTTAPATKVPATTVSAPPTTAQQNVVTQLQSPTITPLPEKPQQAAQMGLTDTGTGQAAPVTTAPSTKVTPTVTPTAPSTTQTPATTPTTTKVTTPTTTTTPTKTTTPTTPSGGVTTPTTGGATGEPTYKAEPVLVQLMPNPYIEEVQNMKFEYDPSQDQDYQMTAASYENQIAQMMVGRGGLYSSVARSALQNSLINLQMEFRKQKYSEFLADRNFKLQMAQFVSAENARAFSQAMQMKEFDLSERQFAFAREKEAFDQKMAIANYNMQKQAQAFSQKMRMMEYEQSLLDAEYKKALQMSQEDLSKAQNIITSNAMQYEREVRTFENYYKRWKNAGTADTFVAKYFGVTQGTTINYGSNIDKIVAKEQSLRLYENDIRNAAYVYQMDARLLEDIRSYYDNRVTLKQSPFSSTVTQTTK